MSHKLFYEAKKYIPGGVNSPVRSFKTVGGYPIFIKKAKGSRILSEDGKSFIDYCQAYGALILGHAHPEVIKAVKKAAGSGTVFGTPTKQETELAKLITKAVPSIQKIRLTNSGTEAVMTAVRLSRAYTKRSKIIKFEGCYHGHADYFLNFKGLPEDFKKHTLVADYNNLEEVGSLVEEHRKHIAAIIVEPVAGNMGVVLPKEGFLKGLRQICDKYNFVLIFDEVITGFRFAYAGAQDLFKVKPDITCLGKIIGGGLPIGVVGGRKEIMNLLAPEGQVYQAGTFSGNPVSVSAGLTALKVLSDTRPYRKLAESTRKLCEGIQAAAKERGFGVNLNFIGPMFSISFEKKNLFKKFYCGLLNEGIYFSPSELEANFLSCAHTDRDLEETLKAIRKILKKLRRN